MSRAFIELHFDEDVSAILAEVIRARGYLVSTTHAVKLRGGSDEIQLEYAASQGKTLLTHNRVDFEALAKEYFESGRSHSGVIIAVRRPPHAIAVRLFPILNSFTGIEMENRILYI